MAGENPVPRPTGAANVPAVAEVEGQVRNEELDAEREARLKRLVARMGELMKDANGVGLAATQVGVLRRVFVFAPEEDKVAAFVNPEIVRRGKETELDDEGCLSIQGVTMPVERSTSVRIEGRDENGEEVGYDLEGTPARIVQHELDHLDGMLILNRTTPEARREALAALRPRLVIR